jgi:hypothetical protein
VAVSGRCSSPLRRARSQGGLRVYSRRAHLRSCVCTLSLSPSLSPSGVCLTLLPPYPRHRHPAVKQYNVFLMQPQRSLTHSHPQHTHSLTLSLTHAHPHQALFLSRTTHAHCGSHSPAPQPDISSCCQGSRGRGTCRGETNPQPRHWCNRQITSALTPLYCETNSDWARRPKKRAEHGVSSSTIPVPRVRMLTVAAVRSPVMVPTVMA